MDTPEAAGAATVRSLHFNDRVDVVQTSVVLDASGAADHSRPPSLPVSQPPWPGSPPFQTSPGNHRPPRPTFSPLLSRAGPSLRALAAVSITHQPLEDGEAFSLWSRVVVSVLLLLSRMQLFHVVGSQHSNH